MLPFSVLSVQTVISEKIISPLLSNCPYTYLAEAAFNSSSDTSAAVLKVISVLKPPFKNPAAEIIVTIKTRLKTYFTGFPKEPSGQIRCTAPIKTQAVQRAVKKALKPLIPHAPP